MSTLLGLGYAAIEVEKISTAPIAATCPMSTAEVRRFELHMKEDESKGTTEGSQLLLAQAASSSPLGTTL